MPAHMQGRLTEALEHISQTSPLTCWAPSSWAFLPQAARLASQLRRSSLFFQSPAAGRLYQPLSSFIASCKPLDSMHASHCSLHLQAAPELHIGLRTGYCGSLTTFASWEYSLVTGLIGGAALRQRSLCWASDVPHAEHPTLNAPEAAPGLW